MGRGCRARRGLRAEPTWGSDRAVVRKRRAAESADARGAAAARRSNGPRVACPAEPRPCRGHLVRPGLLDGGLGYRRGGSLGRRGRCAVRSGLACSRVRRHGAVLDRQCGRPLRDRAARVPVGDPLGVSSRVGRRTAAGGGRPAGTAVDARRRRCFGLAIRARRLVHFPADALWGSDDPRAGLGDRGFACRDPFDRTSGTFCGDAPIGSDFARCRASGRGVCRRALTGGGVSGSAGGLPCGFSASACGGTPGVS